MQPFQFRPYVAKVVERIPRTTRSEREAHLEAKHYNMFELDSAKITLDWLSDSGTGGLFDTQKAAAERADERYAKSRSWDRFHASIADITGYPHILPVHQGRAGERVLFSTLLAPGQISISNTHFDTTAANLIKAGVEVLNLQCREAADLHSTEPFKGNIDLTRLEAALADPDTDVGLVLMTITNNGFGGQPVSMANLEEASELCHYHGVPFFLDAARFAENAWLVIQREPGYADCAPKEVAQRAFQLADGCIMSLKKDGIGHSGGFLGFRDSTQYAVLATALKTEIIMTEGFTTYGGISGYEMELDAVGLQEVLDPGYLASRERDAAYLARLLNEAGVETVQPPGMHGVYLNASRLLPHLEPRDLPGHALACQLYLEGGIRTHELGSLWLGSFDEDHELIKPGPYELLRAAIPRVQYFPDHFEHVAAVAAEIAKDPMRVPGYRILEADPTLRPNTAVFAQRPKSQTSPNEANAHLGSVGH